MSVQAATSKSCSENMANKKPEIKSPMKNHYFSGITSEKNKQLKKFCGKNFHSIAPDSTEKQVRTIQRNYSEIVKSRRKLDFSETVSLEFLIGDSKIEVRKDEITVIEGEKKRTFGIHQQTNHERLYPMRGTAVVTLKGAEVFDLVTNFKGQTDELNFQDFVARYVKKAKLDQFDENSKG